MDQQLLNLEKEVKEKIAKVNDEKSLTDYWLKIFGTKGKFKAILKNLKNIPQKDRRKIGLLTNKIKKVLDQLFASKKVKLLELQLAQIFDVTIPATLPTIGHLHLVSQAITEIEKIFERIGFTRVRYREVEWEWYAFDSLNMPENHPARDDFETFFIDHQPSLQFGKMVLSPHTSSGQLREMERVKGIVPIRMINIAKCYRPNWDISHTPMFHQFEGLVVDQGISITHLKGTMDYFAQQFFGKQRKTRLRPFHFQFTEPSFEVDINCGICLGMGVLASGEKCRLCKSGWLELGGAGMVHPHVLKSGKIDPQKYTGFAFGWGVERTYMMKSGLKIDDIRILYQNDIRFLEQF